MLTHHPGCALSPHTKAEMLQIPQVLPRPLECQYLSVSHGGGWEGKSEDQERLPSHRVVEPGLE